MMMLYRPHEEPIYICECNPCTYQVSWSLSCHYFVSDRVKFLAVDTRMCVAVVRLDPKERAPVGVLEGFICKGPSGLI